VKGAAASAAKSSSAARESKGRASVIASTQRWTSMQGLRASAATAVSALLNSASFMLAVSSLQVLASMVTAMRRAGFSGGFVGDCFIRPKSFRIMELLFQHT
jgi:hypothetical protein